MSEGAMSEESLLKQNEMLLRKVEFLNKIIALKDNTINDLNSKLLAMSKTQTQGKHQPPKSTNTASVGGGNVEPQQKETLINTPNVKHDRTPSTAHSRSSSTAAKEVQKKDTAAFEIPQRSGSRNIATPVSRTHSQLTQQPSRDETPTPVSPQSIASTHVPRVSISSFGSSHYSDSDDNEKEKEPDYTSVHTPLLDKFTYTQPADTTAHNDSNVQPGIDTLVLEDDDTTEDDDSGAGQMTADGNEETATTSLQLELKKGHLTLGSSPRKPSSARTSPITNFHNQTSDTLTDDGLHFNPLATPNEPTYTKINAESLFSTPSDLHVNEKPVEEKGTPKAQDGQDYFSSRNILSRPSLNNKAPSLNLPPSESSEEKSSKSMKTSSSTDGEKFLLNSLEHSVIRIESLIDPIVLSSIHDGHPTSYTATDAATIKMKYNTYKVSFVVFTTENNTLTPIYRVKKTYRELIVMDKAIRPMLPSLPYLPTLDNITSMNIKDRGENKKHIQAYINSLLVYLKNERHLNHHDPVWKNFSNYFEFKIDTDMMDFENAEYSVMNLQEKITYLAYSKRGMSGHRTYDFIRLSFPASSQDLTINFILFKSAETIPKDEVHVTFRGQEIMIKRKKKFSASKTWVFYAESDYDASDICSRLATWIGATDDGTDDEVPDIGNTSTDQLSNVKDQKPTASPSINAPWKLFKKSGKQSQNQNMQQKQQSQQQQLLTSPRPPSSFSISTPSSPSKMSYTSGSASNLSPNPNASPNDVMTFRAIPYDNKMFSSDTMLAGVSSSRNNLLDSPVKMQAKFQPIDDTPRYFKSTLQYSYDLCPKYKLYSHDVPSLVYQCITFLYQQSGEGFEGIFRLNGMMSEVNKIQEIFNTDYDCDLSKLSPKPDVHSIATLLKRYLRNLKDRLISDDVTYSLCQTIGQNSISRANTSNDSIEQPSPTTSPSTLMTPKGVETFHDIFQSGVLPLNKGVLYVLFRYLRDVLKMGKHNKMTVSAMSVLMGPNLTQTDGGGQICIVLLENFNEVFA